MAGFRAQNPGKSLKPSPAWTAGKRQVRQCEMEESRSKTPVRENGCPRPPSALCLPTSTPDAPPSCGCSSLAQPKRTSEGEGPSQTTLQDSRGLRSCEGTLSSRPCLASSPPSPKPPGSGSTRRPCQPLPRPGESPSVSPAPQKGSQRGLGQPPRGVTGRRGPSRCLAGQ